MKISLNAIKWHSYDDLFTLPIEQLADKIGAQLGALEEAPQYLGKLYDGIVVVKVINCNKHPNADKLSVCLVDDGGVVKDVERNKDGLVQVVCGAPNVHENMLVAWLPPGSTVPASVGKEPFVLTARDFRGEKSNGMLASAAELAITDDHDGLLEILPEEVGDELAQPGTPFKQLYGLDDYILEIENKMFTHRPDCFGLLGVGREIAGIQGKAFQSPDWYVIDPPHAAGAGELKVTVRNELPDEVKRFVAVPMSNVAVKPSPVWLQSLLSRLGVRPINNVVDITNYYMLLTGQPLHAYDYDKLKALDGGDSAALVIRNPRSGEKLTLLNGKTVDPRQAAIMIASDSQLIGFGGIMGGANTEVDDKTANIILECASFDMFSIRRSSMAHGLFTDAVSRFNKGQSPLQNLAVALKAVADLAEIAGARVAGPIIDDNHLEASALTRQSLYPPVRITAGFINDRLGLALSTGDIRTLLQNVEFRVEVNDDELTVSAPFWRTDIELREDVVEEVGRLYGYDKLPLQLPARDLTPTPKDQRLELKARLRGALVTAGANEVLSYSFVHGELLNKARQDTAEAFQLSNAISPELQYYRLSLTPSLLDKVHANIKAGYDQFALFELGKVHAVKAIDDQALPLEADRLALVFAADGKASQSVGGAAYYEARKYLLNLLADSGLGPRTLRWQSLSTYEAGSDIFLDQLIRTFEPNRAAVVYGGESLLGIVGEYRASVQRLLKLPPFCAGFEINLSALPATSRHGYVALPRFPSVTQDISLKVSATLSYHELYDVIWDQLGKVQPANSLPELGPVDIYQRESDPEHKQVTLRLKIACYDRTLTDKEVNGLLDAAAAAAKAKYGAERL